MKVSMPRNAILGWAIVAMLTGYPFLAAITQAIGVANTPFAFAYRASLAFTFCFLLLGMRKLHIGLKRDTPTFLLMFFFLFYLIRLYYSTLLSEEPLSRPVEFYWMWFVAGCLLPSITILLQRRSPNFFRLYQPVFLIFLITTILALLFGVTTRIGENGQIYSSGRFQLTALNPISLANVGVTLCILSFWRLWVYPVGIGWIRLMGLFLSFTIGIFLIFLTGSRGPMVSMIFCILILLWYQRGIKKVYFLSMALIFGTLAVIYSTSVSETFEVGTVARLSFLGSADDESAMGRMVSIPSAIRDAIDNPIFGAQLEERITGWYPHNIFAEALMATGLLVGGVMIFATLQIVRLALTSIKYCKEYSWVSLIFLQHFSQAMFSSGIYIAVDFWVSASAVYLATTFPRANYQRPNRRSLMVGRGEVN